MRHICLVSCVRTKLKKPAPAARLYTSPLFRKSSGLAQRRFDRWYILSAQYGLVRPEQIIKPYDLTLNRMTSEQRRQWATKVFAELTRELQPEDDITFLAGQRYCDELAQMLKHAGLRVHVPLRGMGIGKRLRWLNEQLRSKDRAKDLQRFYDLLGILRAGLSGERVLGHCSGTMSWPKRGVYFFFEPGELRADDSPRVVRVGTHGVSRGSQSTLWQRLRTHLGTDAGSGNHRGSIFRLHVGAALLAKSQRLSLPTWGLGQNAARDVRATEETLEREVSAQIRRMSILWIAVEDEPGPASDRAYIERNSIGLLCGPNGPADSPSPRWLGNFSPHASIRKSGLWNVNHIDCRYDARFLDVLEKAIEITLGNRRASDRHLAPRGWYESEGHDNQMALFAENDS